MERTARAGLFQPRRLLEHPRVIGRAAEHLAQHGLEMRQGLGPGGALQRMRQAADLVTFEGAIAERQLQALRVLPRVAQRHRC